MFKNKDIKKPARTGGFSDKEWDNMAKRDKLAVMLARLEKQVSVVWGNQSPK